MLTLAICSGIVILITFWTLDTQQSKWIPKPPSLPTLPTAPWKPTKPVTGFVPPPRDPEDPDFIKLDYLSIRPHKRDKNFKHVKYYWNMPYAAPASGKNRFRGPQPPARIKETLEWDGETLGICPHIQKIDSKQRNRVDVAGEEVRGIDAKVTEDCLSLNVFAPIDAKAGDDLPVCVVIPGGGFAIPGRSDGGAMVEKSRIEKKDGTVEFKGMVTVTMYYRNGIYGFLSGDQIQEDGDFNNGVRDQRAALEWVQKYIRYFGGNPDHVVIMGTSAGGASALMHLTANNGSHTFETPGIGHKQLFHGIIAQSPASPTFFTRSQQNKFYRQVAEGVNCTDLSLSCVRSASTGDLYFQNYPMTFPERNTPPRWMWSPSIEPAGGMWTEPATSAIIGGRYAKVPTIFGFTTNEGSNQVNKETNSLAAMKSYLKDHYPLLSDFDLDVLAHNYPNSKHWPESGKYWDAVARAQGDLRYVCPTYLASNAMSTHNPDGVKTWQYQWDVAAKWDMTNGYGTKHAGSVGLVMSRPRNEISDYFVSFIKNLDPNVERDPKTPEWTPLDPKAPKRALFSNREGKLGEKEVPLKVTIEDPDQARHKRCEDIHRMAPRLQQALGMEGEGEEKE